MKLIKIFLNLFLIICLNSMAYDSYKEEEKKFSFVAIGHLYPIMHDIEAIDKIFEEIRKLNPDFVFILGDSNLHKEETHDLLSRYFNKNIFFVPGNSELVEGNLNQYFSNVGYLNKIIDHERFRFILLNSLDSEKEINNFLKTIPSPEENKSTIVLTHHRIWDDTLISKDAMMHDKSYYFKEIFPYFKDVDYIFAGNSKRQYFSDLKTSGLQNLNNAFWVDTVGDIICYSIGMGDGYPKAHFVYAQSIGKKLFVEPKSINFIGQEPIPTKYIKPAKGSYTKELRPLITKVKNFIKNHILDNLEWYFILISFFAFSLGYVYKKK